MKTDVSFASAGFTLAGHLYSPRVLARGRHPAIIVGHPASGVKEQTAGLYARRLAEHGFIALAFDSAYQGESGGEPRGLEDPAQRVEDLKSAVSFMSVCNDVDPERIVMLGICASAGYAIAATATDHRVKAVATVSGTDIGWFFRNGPDRKQDPSVLQGMLDHAAIARSAEARGEGLQAFWIHPANEAEARGAGQYVYEGWEYYCTPRGQHPRSAKRLPWQSVDRIASFDGFGLISMVAPRPLLMVVGRNAATSWMTTDAFVNARRPKELCWVEGASHVDLYDKEQYMTPVVAQLNDFYRTALLKFGSCAVSSTMGAPTGQAPWSSSDAGPRRPRRAGARTLADTPD